VLEYIADLQLSVSVVNVNLAVVTKFVITVHDCVLNVCRITEMAYNSEPSISMPPLKK